MKVVFSDEVGTGNIKEEPISAVTAIPFNMDQQWRPVSEHLRKIVASAPSHLLIKGELKGRHLLNRARKGKDQAAIDTLLDQILAVFTNHALSIFFAAVDRERYQKEIRPEGGRQKIDQMSEHDLAFQLCLDEVDTDIRRFCINEQILWIADTTGHAKHLKRTLELYRRWQQLDLNAMLRGARGASGLQFSEPHMPNIADTIYFGPAKESLALQLADVCCSVLVNKLLGDPTARRHYPQIGNRVRPLRLEVYYADQGRYDTSFNPLMPE